MWLIVSIAGGVVQGSTVTVATTTLTSDITDSDNVIPVTSTEGFPDTGFVTILDERIGYASTTANTFEGNLAQPLVRGASDTIAVAHDAGENVRTLESSMLNQSMGYRLAVMTDASGVLAFVTIPFAFIILFASFLVLPLAFLGSDLEILAYIWGVLSIGLLVALGISLAGGRRV
jgi:hypothetical protein